MQQMMHNKRCIKYKIYLFGIKKNASKIQVTRWLFAHGLAFQASNPPPGTWDNKTIISVMQEGSLAIIIHTFWLTTHKAIIGIMVYEVRHLDRGLMVVFPGLQLQIKPQAKQANYPASAYGSCSTITISDPIASQLRPFRWSSSHQIQHRPILAKRNI